MKCPECVKDGLKSCVYPGMSFRTLGYFRPYYDQSGMYHHEDRNKTTTEYKCSNGHQWKETS